MSIGSSSQVRTYVAAEPLPKMVTVQDAVNILMVDDQPGKLLTYEAILSDLGENLIKANSAKEALEKLLKMDVAVVLMDVSMPEIDGFELAEIIRQHPRFQKTAIIFISAVHLTDLDRLKGYQHGAVDYLSVPIVPEVLRAKVKVFAELHRKNQQLERLNAELEKRVAERTEELEHKALALEKLNTEMGQKHQELDAIVRTAPDIISAEMPMEPETTSAPAFTNTRALLRTQESDSVGWIMCIPMTRSKAFPAGCNAYSPVKVTSATIGSGAQTPRISGSGRAQCLSATPRATFSGGTAHAQISTIARCSNNPFEKMQSN